MNPAPKEPASTDGAPRITGRLSILAMLALWIMAPVTMPVPVLRELVQERFVVSEFETSIFMSINMLGALFAAPFAGSLADRFGHQRALLVGGLVADSLLFLALAQAVSFPAFLVLRFFEGCAHIVALSILLSLASHALPDAHRGRAMGLVGGGMMLGVALGAPIGGAFARAGATAPLFAGSALLAGAALVAALGTRDLATRDDRASLRDIGLALRARPAILVALAFAFADRFTVGFFTTTFSLYLRRIHDVPPLQIGLLIATFMLPFALLSYPVGRVADKRSIVLLLCVGTAAYGVLTASVGFTGPPALWALMFLIGTTAAVMFVPSMMLTLEIAPTAIRATALGAFNAAGSLGFILGPITGGAISESVAAGSGWLAGYRAAFLTAGASVLLCVAATVPFLLRLRRQGTVR